LIDFRLKCKDRIYSEILARLPHRLLYAAFFRPRLPPLYCLQPQPAAPSLFLLAPAWPRAAHSARVTHAEYRAQNMRYRALKGDFAFAHLRGLPMLHNIFAGSILLS
jgi:hypothetical protein